MGQWSLTKYEAKSDRKNNAYLLEIVEKVTLLATPVNAFDNLTKSETTGENCMTSGKNTGLNQSSPGQKQYMGELCWQRGTVRYLTRTEVLSGILVLGSILLLIFHQWCGEHCKIYQLTILKKFAADTKFCRTTDTKKERLKPAPTNLDEWGQKWGWSSLP